MSANENIQKIAKILRADAMTLEKTIEGMERITGKTAVIDEIISENGKYIERVMRALNIAERKAEYISAGIEELIRKNDKILYEVLGRPYLSFPSSSKILIYKARQAVGEDEKGFFLKKEKAREMLIKAPPIAIIQGLGYRNIYELLEKERLEEIFAALRFIETREWMNAIFVKQYTDLTPDDFEERPIEIFVLQEKWLSLAEKFLENKYHNVSHLKELGVAFIIPIKLDTTGETLRLFSLILHYLYEIPFYSKLIFKYSLNPASFSQNLISLIRGDVKNYSLDFSDGFIRWLIVQRYLSKDDENDPRIFIPHINPEAIHWRKAQRALIQFASTEPRFDLNVFDNLDFVGDFFPSKKVGELLVSFDLVDNIMGLVKQDVMIKYLYHHQEALWNRIFAGFIGEEKMEEMILDSLDKGYIDFYSN